MRKDNVELYGDRKMLPPFELDAFNTEREARAVEDAALKLKRASEAAETIAPSSKCSVDHFKEGFEGQSVYVWRGPYKGKLGSIYQMSGAMARVGFDSAFKGNSVVDIHSENLVA